MSDHPVLHIVCNEEDVSSEQSNNNPKEFISEAKVDFPSLVELANEMKSPKIIVPEMSAAWWMEVNSKPNAKIMMEFYDENIFKSKLFSASIEIDQPAVVHGTFFQDATEVDIKSAKIGVDMKSQQKAFTMGSTTGMKLNFASPSTPKMKQSTPSATSPCFLFGVNLSSKIQSPSELSPASKFYCKITFKYVGKSQTSITDAIKELKRTDSTHSLLLNNSHHSDFTIKVGEKTFNVNKSILARASEAFRAMFSADESKNNLDVEGCKPEIFEHLLCFIYNRVIPTDVVNYSVFFDLHKLAHRYKIEMLCDICERHIVLAVAINELNALRLYNFAVTYEVDDLLRTSWNFIKTQMLDIHEPCLPQPLEKVKQLLAERFRYENCKKSFLKGKQT